MTRRDDIVERVFAEHLDATPDAWAIYHLLPEGRAAIYHLIEFARRFCDRLRDEGVSEEVVAAALRWSIGPPIPQAQVDEWRRQLSAAGYRIDTPDDSRRRETIGESGHYTAANVETLDGGRNRP